MTDDICIVRPALSSIVSYNHININFFYKNKLSKSVRMEIYPRGQDVLLLLLNPKIYNFLTN